jgi:acyl carrier protein
VKTINWGYWGNVGVVADEFHRGVMRQMGVGSIEAEEGMAALQALMGSDLRQMILIRTLTREATESLVAAGRVARVGQPSGEAGARTHAAGEAKVGDAGPVTMGMVEQIVGDKLSEALRMDRGRIKADVPILEYGVDSIIGINLVRLLSDALAIDLEATKLFEYGTVKSLAQYISTHWATHLAGRESASLSIGGGTNGGAPHRFSVLRNDRSAVEAMSDDGYEKATF